MPPERGQHPYDAYIVDLNLPGVYGLTVLERLRAHAPNAPVAILTGIYGEPESASVALMLGASDFWTKPLPAELSLRPCDVLLAIRPSVAVVSPPPTPIVRYGIVAASSTMRGVIEWGSCRPVGYSRALTGGIGPQRHPI